MGTPFVAELRLLSFNFAPQGWAQANGQLLPINQNQPLFALLGTTYGGNGQTNFALPDLRARVPISLGNGFTLGQKGGESAHTITINEMPAHTHFAAASGDNADNVAPAANIFGAFNAGYAAPASLTNIVPTTITQTGGSQPHENRQPFLVMNYAIALQGLFPSQN